MRRISRRDFETCEKIKKFMGENKFDEEDLRKYVNRTVHLKVSSEGMEPSTFKNLSEASTVIGVSRQTLEYAHKHKRPRIARRKCGAKLFFIEWLEPIQYLSQLDKYYYFWGNISPNYQVLR